MATERESAPVRVGVYARISVDADGTQTATARQLADCRAFAQHRHWEVTDVFEDVDISAYQTKVKRPEFERMLAGLTNGELDGIVVWKLDRLTRQQRDLVRVMAACETRKAFVASVVEQIDTREAHGQFVTELLVAQARMESANSSTRQRRKAVQQRETGRPPSSGIRCFGYTKGYTAIVPEEAALVREAVEGLFAGRSLNGVCSDWESRGVQTTQGNSWRTQVLKKFLTSSTISGQREFEGKLMPGTWPALISPEETVRLRSLFPRQGGRPAVGTARKYLLTGIVRCGLCGERLKGNNRTDQSPRYVCRKDPGYRQCGKVSTLALPVEDLVLEMLIVALDDGALADALSARGEQDDGILAAVRQDEQALEALANDFYVEQLVTREEFFAARAGLTKRLEANRQQLARREARGAIGAFVGAGVTLRDAWAKGTLDWRRAVVASLLDRVLIMPTKRKGRVPFDVERVKPVWRY